MAFVARQAAVARAAPRTGVPGKVGAAHFADGARDHPCGLHQSPTQPLPSCRQRSQPGCAWRPVGKGSGKGRAASAQTKLHKIVHEVHHAQWCMHGAAAALKAQPCGSSGNLTACREGFTSWVLGLALVYVPSPLRHPANLAQKAAASCRLAWSRASSASLLEPRGLVSPAAEASVQGWASSSRTEASMQGSVKHRGSANGRRASGVHRAGRATQKARVRYYLAGFEVAASSLLDRACRARRSRSRSVCRRPHAAC